MASTAAASTWGLPQLVASYRHAKKSGELRCARQCACAPGPQQARRVGSEEPDDAGGGGRARLSMSGQWSLSISQASPTVTPITQGVAAQEAIA